HEDLFGRNTINEQVAHRERHQRARLARAGARSHHGPFGHLQRFTLLGGQLGRDQLIHRATAVSDSRRWAHHGGQSSATRTSPSMMRSTASQAAASALSVCCWSAPTDKKRLVN